jgi:hypothetical protein
MSAQTQLCLTALTPSGSEWVTADQALQITGWSDEWLRQQVRTGSVISREGDQRAANGRPTRLYLAASLPARHALELVPTSTQISLPLFAAAPKVPDLRITLPDPAAQKLAEQRLEILRPILEYDADREKWSTCQLDDKSYVNSKTQFVRYIAQINRLSEGTVWNWYRALKKNRFEGLAKKPRRDKGNSHWADESAANREMAELAAYGYLHESLHKKMCWEIVKCRAGQLGIAAPSYETIRAMLKNIPAPVRTLALEGRRKYDEVFAPYICRGYEDMEAGEIIVSDHALHDVLVQNDLFDLKDRQHMRLRFTGLIDMRSRKFLGYAWSQEGSSRSITRSLRHMFMKYGPARLFYCDNGKDYQKAGRGGRSPAWRIEEIPPEAIGVIARLGMEIGFCLPFHPQSKLIERANNTIHQRFDRRFITYTGPTPEQRPDRCIAALERHQKLLAQGRADESDLPLASEFIKAAVAWIEGEYHTITKLKAKGMQGLTPNEAFEKFRWQNQPPTPEPQVLDCLLAERVQRTIHEGSIELLNRRYVGIDDLSRKELHDRSGTKRKYTVAFDYPDADFLAAIDDDGYVFAHLEPETLVRHGNDPETQAAIAASMKERGHRYKETRAKLNTLSQRVLSTGYVPQNDQMLQIGRLPGDIEGFVVHRPTNHKLIPHTTPNAPLTPAQAARLFLERQKKND